MNEYDYNDDKDIESGHTDSKNDNDDANSNGNINHNENKDNIDKGSISDEKHGDQSY